MSVSLCLVWHKGMTFCRSIYVKRVMELLAFIFEQPSYKINGLRAISKVLSCGTRNKSNLIFQ